MFFERDARLLNLSLSLIYLDKAIKDLLAGTPFSHEKQAKRSLKRAAEFFDLAARYARFIDGDGVYPAGKFYWNPGEALLMILKEGNNPIRQQMEKELAGESDTSRIPEFLQSFADIFIREFHRGLTDEEREKLEIAKKFFDGLRNSNDAELLRGRPFCSGGGNNFAMV